MKAVKIYLYLENIFWILFAYLSFPFIYLFILLKKKSKEPQRILVIQTAKIGDLVCTTPVFREIKKHYPQSYLSVLVIPLTKDILINNPHIDEVILFDRKNRGILKLIREIKIRDFDWSFSLVPGVLNTLIPFWSVIPHRVSTISKYASKSTKILSILNNYRLEYQKNTLALRHYLNLLKFINIKEFNEEKELFVSSKDKEKAVQFMKGHKLSQEDFSVALSITAGKEFKEWAPEKFAQLADKLIENLKAKIVFIGSPNDESIIEKTQSLMKNKSVKVTGFNLIELTAFLKELSLFIGVDTGPLYIADAVGISVVDIAGPCEMRSQQPSGKFIIVQKSLDCSPCSFIMSAPSYCKKGHSKCIKDITVDDVFQAVEKLLKEL